MTNVIDFIFDIIDKFNPFLGMSRRFFSLHISCKLVHRKNVSSPIQLETTITYINKRKSLINFRQLSKFTNIKQQKSKIRGYLDCRRRFFVLAPIRHKVQMYMKSHDTC